MAREIERKFLLESLPEDLKIEERKTIYQSYLAVGKEEVRIRRVTYGDGESKFYLTYKNRTGEKMSREEIEVEIGEKTYDQLNKLSVPLIKERFLIKIQDGLFAEADIYENIGFELMTVEVEFSSMEEAEGFVPPAWFGRELTGTKEFNNQYLFERVNGKKF
jgi:adenylate cyclase